MSEPILSALRDLQDLPVPADSQEGVAAQLRVLAQMAQLVREFPLGAEYEPAPIFQP